MFLHHELHRKKLCIPDETRTYLEASRGRPVQVEQGTPVEEPGGSLDSEHLGDGDKDCDNIDEDPFILFTPKKVCLQIGSQEVRADKHNVRGIQASVWACMPPNKSHL